MGLGLKMKSLVYGARYDSAVDEMFVLSDGAPNLGDVIDPVEILELTTETNRFNNVRINTVYISSPHEQNPENNTLSPIDLMRRMAAGARLRDAATTTRTSARTRPRPRSSTSTARASPGAWRAPRSRTRRRPRARSASGRTSALRGGRTGAARSRRA